LRFSDGTPVTARDAAYSITRLLDKSLGSFATARLELSLTTGGIVAADDQTLVLRTKQPDAFLPLALAVPWTAIVKNGTTDFSVQTAIGTGPFQATSFTPGQSWEVKRNPYYWRKGFPYLDGVQAVNIPEQTTKIQSVISGDTDITDYIEFSAVPMIQASNTARILELKSATDIRFVMKGTVAPFNDTRVTMAIKLAADRDLLLRTVFRGFGTITTDVPVPPGDPLYPPDLSIRRQDIDRAKSLLKEAGYPGGLDLDLYVAEIFGGLVDSAVVFAQAVRSAGIRVNIKNTPTQTFLSEDWLKAPFYISYLNRRHPSNVFPLSFTSTAIWPEGQLHSEKFDALTADATRTTNIAVQRRLYREGMLIIANEAPIHIPLFVSRLHTAKKRLQGVKLHPEKFLRFDEAFIQKA
jgi:peptide/nickel transport system substrate-binding protein